MRGGWIALGVGLILAGPAAAADFRLQVDPGCAEWELDAVPGPVAGSWALAGQQIATCAYFGVTPDPVAIAGTAYRLPDGRYLVAVTVPAFVGRSQEHLVILDPKTLTGTLARGAGVLVVAPPPAPAD